jgi:hypothetical protein
MSEVTPNAVARVDLAEFERGWGSEIYEKKYFSDWDEAVQYVRDFNKKNNEAVVPDYYTVAQGPYRL